MMLFCGANKNCPPVGPPVNEELKEELFNEELFNEMLLSLKVKEEAKVGLPLLLFTPSATPAATLAAAAAELFIELKSALITSQLLLLLFVPDVVVVVALFPVEIVAVPLGSGSVVDG